jgi:hypothetical protein
VHPAVFALNDEAFTNFAYAAYKKTNDVALELAPIYYGRKPTKNYYMGGSEGDDRAALSRRLRRHCVDRPVCRGRRSFGIRPSHPGSGSSAPSRPRRHRWGWS